MDFHKSSSTALKKESEKALSMKNIENSLKREQKKDDKSLREKTESVSLSKHVFSVDRKKVLNNIWTT